MTTEQLLRPRYKVIASYPNMTFDLGEIIELSTGDDLRFQTNDKKIPYCYHKRNGPTCEQDLINYPGIFKKLEWWEERKAEEIPDYLNIDGKIIKRFWGYGRYIYENEAAYNNDNPTDLKHCLPATKEEYENQNIN